MNEIQLRDLSDRFTYLSELEERKSAILSAVARTNLPLKVKITDCLQKTELEDLYLPYRPKRRTRATIARKGLERWRSSSSR